MYGLVCAFPCWIARLKQRLRTANSRFTSAGEVRRSPFFVPSLVRTRTGWARRWVTYRWMSLPSKRRLRRCVSCGQLFVRETGRRGLSCSLRCRDAARTSKWRAEIRVPVDSACGLMSVQQ